MLVGYACVCVGLVWLLSCLEFYFAGFDCCCLNVCDWFVCFLGVGMYAMLWLILGYLLLWDLAVALIFGF